MFDVLVAKLRIPPTRPGSVRRARLIERLEREVSRPVVSVVASAGYGKTTLLAQWAEHSGQAVAWVSVDEQDNDPKVLLGYVARALDVVQPVGRLVFDALASPASSVPGSVVPRLGNAFAAMTVPVLLILDDVHLLRNSECRAALSVLADHVPGRGAWCWCVCGDFPDWWCVPPAHGDLFAPAGALSLTATGCGSGW